jgi:hypothetical protein
MNKFSTSTLKNQLERARFLQEKREESFSDKSEKWQESEKGEAFEFRTQELEGIIDDLENAIDALETWNEEA